MDTKPDPLPGPFSSVYQSGQWRALVARLIAERGRRCEACGTRYNVDGTNIWLIGDHIVELEDGGAPFEPSNVALLCAKCHGKKTHDAKRQRDPATLTPRASSHPDWLRPSLIPLHIVCGPPASGKSRLVRQRASPHDLILDLDDIACRLAGIGLTKAWDADKWLGPALRARNDMLGKLSRRPPQWEQAFLTLLEPDPGRRQWWADKMQPASITVLRVDQSVCAERIRQDPQRADPRIQAEHQRVLTEWFAKYRPAACDGARPMMTMSSQPPLCA